MIVYLKMAFRVVVLLLSGLDKSAKIWHQHKQFQLIPDVPLLIFGSVIVNVFSIQKFRIFRRTLYNCKYACLRTDVVFNIFFGQV